MIWQINPVFIAYTDVNFNIVTFRDKHLYVEANMCLFEISIFNAFFLIFWRQWTNLVVLEKEEWYYAILGQLVFNDVLSMFKILYVQNMHILIRGTESIYWIMGM